MEYFRKASVFGGICRLKSLLIYIHQLLRVVASDSAVSKLEHDSTSRMWMFYSGPKFNFDTMTSANKIRLSIFPFR